MIVEYTRYKIDSTRREAFEMAYKKAVGSLDASSQCLAYELSTARKIQTATSFESSGIPKKAT